MLYCPDPSPDAARSNHRIFYRDRNGRRCERSGTRRHDVALARVSAKIAELSADLGEYGPRTVGHLVDAFTAEQKKQGNALTHTDKTAQMASRFIVPQLGSTFTYELTRENVGDMLDKATAPSAKRHLRAAIGAMLTWAHEQGKWGIQPRAFYLPKRARTGQQDVGREHGASSLFIPVRYRPGKNAVRDLAAAMRTAGVGKLRDGVEPTARHVLRGLQLWLMVAIAACCGLRQGELFALTAGQISADGSRILIDRQLVRPDGGGWIVTPPKWGRSRWVPLPPRTWWGDRLRRVLLGYVTEIGLTVGEWHAFDPEKNSPPPADLLFRAPAGGYLHYSNFDGERVFGAARKATPAWSKEWTWHSLRHTFCSQLINGDPETGRKPVPASDVTVLAGHRHSHTTMSMYVGASEDAIDNVNAALSDDLEARRERLATLEAQLAELRAGLDESA